MTSARRSVEAANGLCSIEADTIASYMAVSGMLGMSEFACMP
jgi:hypothetical protein